MEKHLGNIRNFKYPNPELMDKETAHRLYEHVKQGILVRLHSCDAIETHLNYEIPLKAKRTMCFQLYTARVLSYMNPADKPAVAHNLILHKPWCMQEWFLPGMGNLGNAFNPRFEPSTLLQSLREQARDLGIGMDENTLSRCYAATTNIFCELLFMYLLVKHENTPIEQMMRNHLRYQSAYEQYACRQWLAQYEADGLYGVRLPLTAEDLARIDKVRI